MDCPSIPKFCLDFLLRSKTYVKEHPSSASTVNWEFPLSNKLGGCGETGLHTLQGANYTAAVVYTSTRYSADHVTHCMHCLACFIMHNIDISNVDPSPCLSPMLGVPPVGPFCKKRYYAETQKWH